jgi:hypothetical protein
MELTDINKSVLALSAKIHATAAKLETLSTKMYQQKLELAKLHHELNKQLPIEALPNEFTHLVDHVDSPAVYAHERDFIRSIAGFETLSPKQAKWANDIATRLHKVKSGQPKLTLVELCDKPPETEMPTPQTILQRLQQKTALRKANNDEKK